jgi:DNA-binding NarL/FixJ family response regulator
MRGRVGERGRELADDAVPILMADTHALFRAGMHYLLRDLPGAIEIFEAERYSELHERLQQHSYKLILLDPSVIEMSPEKLREVCRIACAPVVIISALDSPSLIHEMLQEGVSGFIPKNSLPRIMVQALGLVLAGGLYVPPTVLQLIPRSAPESPGADSTARCPQLTGRQRMVLAQLAIGASNKQIAHSLSLSEGAVKAHIAGLLRILSARNRTAALIKASELGWIERPYAMAQLNQAIES